MLLTGFLIWVVEMQQGWKGSDVLNNRRANKLAFTKLHLLELHGPKELIPNGPEKCARSLSPQKCCRVTDGQYLASSSSPVQLQVDALTAGDTFLKSLLTVSQFFSHS